MNKVKKMPDGNFRHETQHLCDSRGNTIYDPECEVCSAGDLRVYLDDERILPDGFDVSISSAHAAIELLKTGKVLLISLDHDLGSGCETGQVVADFIEKSAYEGTLKPIKIQIHTQNPVGRVKMCQALNNAKRYWKEQK